MRTSHSCRILPAILMFILVAPLSSLEAQAQDFTVITIDAGDEQALKDAIRGANQTNTTLTIRIVGDEPFVFDSVDNETMGPNLLPPIETDIVIKDDDDFGFFEFMRAEGAPDGRFFYVAPGGDLLIRKAKLLNGSVPGDGGAILVDGELIIADVKLDGNRASEQGGAIAVGEMGDALIVDTFIINNQSGGDGGAVSSRGDLRIERSFVFKNSSEGFGGAADCAGGQNTLLTLINTLLHGNAAASGAGGLHSNGCALHMNNSRVTNSQGDGAWLAGPTTINNSVFGGNTPDNCQVFGPPPTRNHSWFSDTSCGTGGFENRVEPELDGFYDSPLWEEIVKLPFGGPDLDQPVSLPPAYREAVDELGMTGSGSPDAPGTSDTACAPIGLNGFPVVPPVAPCTPGVFQFPIPGEVPPTLSGHWYDPKLEGTGFNLLDLGDGTYRLEFLGYGENGAQMWRSNRGYPAGVFIVFPDPLGDLPPGPPGTPPADIIIDPVSCESEDAGNLDFFGPLIPQIPDDQPGTRRTNFEYRYLTEVACTTPGKAIQDGHSGGFMSGDRPLDRFTLFILTRGEALFHWMTVNDEGLPAWFFGVGQFDGDSVVFDELFVTSGPTFPEGYDPADLELEPAGSATVAFSDCDNASLTYEVQAVGGAGMTAIQRDLSLAGTNCSDN